MTEAMFYERQTDGTVTCMLCPHGCDINEGETGICGVRRNLKGMLYAESYGNITSIALDPIEKKPLRRFLYPRKLHESAFCQDARQNALRNIFLGRTEEESARSAFLSGSKVLSVGSYGCNFSCSFCQNHEISVIGEHGEKPDMIIVQPEVLVEKALELVPEGNIGLAYTYNEPFISYEYMLHCSMLCREKGLKNVIVTNGFVNIEPLLRILPYVDAMNIDLKSFEPDFYTGIGGKLDCVRQVIKTASEHCHVEVTTLIIPGENDSDEEMERLSGWLSEVDNNIPLHITRFYPRHRMAGIPAAPIERLAELRVVAARRLKYVY